MNLREAYIEIRPEFVEDRTFFDLDPKVTLVNWKAEVTGVTKLDSGFDADFSLAALGATPGAALLQLEADMKFYGIEVAS